MTQHNPSSTYITDLSWANPQRAYIFEQWLTALLPQFNLQLETLRPACADASFRRYFRITSKNKGIPSYIIMDAPPEQENSQPFVDVAKLLKDAGIRVPEILNWDKVNGFLLITDLGSQTILEAVQANPDPDFAHDLLKQSIGILVRLQLASKPNVLPLFDESCLRRDLNLLSDWYIAKHRQFTLSDEQKNTLENAFQLIIKRSLASPKVYIHRDYMPRNLMVGVPLPDGSTSELGLLDFQDAAYGPITYDIASLMRDAFQSWEEELVLDITIRYWEDARKAGLPVDADFSDFWVSVEWMGLQRHLKILGIFARLTLRDDKPKYLADAPRFIHYVRTTCNRYRDLGPLLQLILQIEGVKPEYGYMYGR